MSDQQPPEDAIVDLSGPPGESLFDRPLTWCLQPNAQDEVQTWVDKELRRLEETRNERALAVVGALLVEDAVDELLSAVMPGYGRLREDLDFTFAVKTKLARSLSLIPSRFLACADVIRKVRNDFAHCLSIEFLSSLSAARQQAIGDRLREFNGSFGDTGSNVEMFRELVTWTYIGLRVYGQHVVRLNRLIRQKNFVGQVLKKDLQKTDCCDD